MMRSFSRRQSVRIALIALWLGSFVGVGLLHGATPHPLEATHPCPICLFLHHPPPPAPPVDTAALAAPLVRLTRLQPAISASQPVTANLRRRHAPRGPPL